ncbi:hypothetical protein Gogos_021619, partial [Gossypium gossypioides]|nr:hypothetical protein [Gossypium gossypioides]
MTLMEKDLADLSLDEEEDDDVKVHDLPSGYFLDHMAQQLGEFVGKFLDYETKEFNQGLRNFMRIKDDSSRAQPRRASITPNMWLREDNMGRHFGKVDGKEE